MNSFHDIGLPMHSTLLSVNASSSEESQSETVMFKGSFDAKNEVGLPIMPSLAASNHRRYDSAPVTQTSNKMKILENDEKSMKVLWV